MHDSGKGTNEKEITFNLSLAVTMGTKNQCPFKTIGHLGQIAFIGNVL
jgi:hypothetical protein